jgi:PRTRC genetic system protein A
MENERPKGVMQLAVWAAKAPTKVDELQAATTYVPTRDGVKVIRKLPYGVIVEDLVGDPLIESPFPLYEKGPKCALYITSPRIPWAIYAQIVAFFRAVHAKEKAEAIIRVFYDEATGTWYPHCPEQNVSAGNVNHKDDFDSEGKFRHVADIHSHHTMSPFFSGTDDADEKKAVRLYGVVGNIDRPIPGSSWRAWTGKKFETLTIQDVVEMPATEEITLPIRFKVGAILNEKEGAKNLAISSEEIAAQLFPSEFPEEWMKTVNAKSWSQGFMRGTAGAGTSSRTTSYGPAWRWNGDHWWRLGSVPGTLDIFKGKGHPAVARDEEFETIDDPDYIEAEEDHSRGSGAPAGFRPGTRHFGGSGRGKPGKESGTREGRSEGSDARGRLVPDHFGTAADMVPMALEMAKADEKLIYLVDVGADIVYRVWGPKTIEMKAFPSRDLTQMKERKAKSDMEVVVLAALNIPLSLIGPYFNRKVGMQ